MIRLGEEYERDGFDYIIGTGSISSLEMTAAEKKRAAARDRKRPPFGFARALGEQGSARRAKGSSRRKA